MLATIDICMANSFMYHTDFQVQAPIITYKGPITHELIAKIKGYIQRTFKKTKAHYKLLAIFIELAQNVIVYSEEQNTFIGNESVGTLIIDERDDCYLLITGNTVSNSSVETLLERCEYINSLDRDGLRKFKRDLRKKDKDQKNKRAGIGLVQMALLSGHGLQVIAERINDEFTYLGFCVKVMK
ncbi:SiaB family protein kinase [uncultured Microscilla sp.]|uniref:SiaB family protein kinase n=1 Tax=uncultured Microscilla sp. TaxID=432653 RepID=UPI00263714C6|nr:SiaB family protein kinase [uncultured Microscilla sp.]